MDGKRFPRYFLKVTVPAFWLRVKRLPSCSFLLPFLCRAGRGHRHPVLHRLARSLLATADLNACWLESSLSICGTARRFLSGGLSGALEAVQLYLAVCYVGVILQLRGDAPQIMSSKVKRWARN